MSIYNISVNLIGLAISMTSCATIAAFQTLIGIEVITGINTLHLNADQSMCQIIQVALKTRSKNLDK